MGAKDYENLRGVISDSCGVLSLSPIFILIASITPRDLLALITTEHLFLLMFDYFFLDLVLRFFLGRGCLLRRSCAATSTGIKASPLLNNKLSVKYIPLKI